MSKIATSISQLCLFMPGLRLPAIIAIIALVAATSHYSNAYAQSPEVTTLPMTSGLKTPKVSSTPLKAPGKTTGAATTPAEKSLSKSGSSSTGGDKSIATGCRTGGSKISGGRLLFTLVYQNRRQIYGSDLGAQNVFPVITEPGDNYAASISPDGLRFAFISNRTGSPQVFVSAWDGSDIKQLTTSSLKKGYPSWSGDGNTVYFGGESGSSDTNESTTGNVYSVKSSGGPEVQITSFEGRNIAPAVQPDGRTVAYSTNRFWPGWDICLFDMTQKKESCVLAGSHSFIKPRISRDGKLLAFVQTQSTSSQIGVLAVTNRAGGNEYFSSAEHETDPTWGNSDQEIFASSGSTSEEVHRIILKNLKTKQSETIIACSYSLKEPTWSSITQSELDEKRIIGQFKIIQAITPPVGTPQGYTPPYIKPETK